MTLRTGSAVLLKCDFGKAPQLTRMQTFAFLRFQPFERVKSDLEMLADAPTVELAGHARELDLSVQRLVRDAQQRAVGHTKAETIGRYGGRLHVKRHGA